MILHTRSIILHCVIILLGTRISFAFSVPASKIGRYPSNGGRRNTVATNAIDDKTDMEIALETVQNTTTTISTTGSRPLLLQRQLLWKAPLGAVGLYAYGRLFYNALSVRDIVYPIAHEEQVANTIATAMTAAAAAAAASSSDADAFRVLEVGMGKDARLIRRGLYDRAIQQVIANQQQKEQQRRPLLRRIELHGLDIQVPTDPAVLNDARRQLQQLESKTGVSIDFTLTKSSITSSNNEKNAYDDGTPVFPSGYFDVVLCCLTLCSVNNPNLALTEMKRLLRLDGGTLGYIEHVAVDSKDKRHQFLAFQQSLLDPLQQRVADNCHLRRNTDELIHAAFSVSTASTPSSSRCLQQERFFVDSMWPVSCQASGVIQRTIYGSRTL